MLGLPARETLETIPEESHHRTGPLAPRGPFQMDDLYLQLCKINATLRTCQTGTFPVDLKNITLWRWRNPELSDIMSDAQIALQFRHERLILLGAGRGARHLRQ